MAGHSQPILALHCVFLLPDPLSLEPSGYLLLLPEGSRSSPHKILGWGLSAGFPHPP